MITERDANTFLKKVVFCELLSRTGFQEEQKYRKNVMHLTSMVAPTKQKLSIITYKNTIFSIFRLFSHWSNVWLITLILLLLTVAGSAGFIAWNYFYQQKNSPRLNHLIVSGNRFEQQEIDPSLLVSLSQKPWGPKKNKGRNKTNAYGRTSGGRKPIMLGNTKADTSIKWDVSLLAANFSEPIFKTIDLKIGDTLSTLKPTGKTISDYKNKDDEKIIVISVNLMEEMLKNKDEKIVPKYLWIKMFGQYIKLRLVGLTDYLPEDRSYIFNGVIDTALYTKILLTNDKRPQEYVNNKGELKLYERAVVYFDYENFDSLSRYLDKEGFLFSRDNFKKISKMNNLATIVFSIFMLMLIAILLLTVFLMTNTFSLYIKENNLSLAVMKAAGAELTIFKRLVSSLVAYDCMVAMTIGGGVLFLLGFIISFFDTSSIVGLNSLYMISFFGYIASSLLILLIGNISVRLLLNSWWDKNKYPANSLRSN